MVVSPLFIEMEYQKLKEKQKNKMSSGSYAGDV